MIFLDGSLRVFSRFETMQMSVRSSVRSFVCCFVRFPRLTSTKRLTHVVRRESTLASFGELGAGEFGFSDLGVRRWEGERQGVRVCVYVYVCVCVWVRGGINATMWSCSGYFRLQQGGGRGSGLRPGRAAATAAAEVLASFISSSLYPVALILTSVYTHRRRLLLPPIIHLLASLKTRLCPPPGCVWLVTSSFPK